MNADIAHETRAVRSLPAVPPVRPAITGSCSLRPIRPEVELPRDWPEFQQMMDTLPHQVFLLDPGFSMQIENRSAREYLGLSEAASAKDRTAEITHPEDLEKVRRMYRRAASGGEAAGEKARIRRWNGEYRWFDLHLYPLRDDLGRIVRWCGTWIQIDDFRPSSEAVGP